MARKSEAQKQAEKEMAKFNVNYATSQKVADRALKHVIDKVGTAKNGRRAKEEEWIEDLRLWSCQLTDGQLYQGRSNLIIPELHNQVETSVGKFQMGLFPNEDYLGVVPTGSTSKEEAQQIKDAVFHELDHKNNLPAKLERFQRQKTLFGTAFIKPTFEEQYKTIFVKNEKGYAEPKKVVKYSGAKVDVCDTFRVYVWPENVGCIEDADLVFEEMFISKRYLEEAGLYANLKDIQDGAPGLADFSWVDVARMNMTNLASASHFNKEGVLVTECWCDFDIAQGEYKPCVITLANMSTVIRVQLNPFWHQQAPYLMGRYMKGPAGEMYGHSLAERLRSMQYMITDLGNQTMDSLTYTLNPIALIDPGFAGDVNSFKLQPGARWWASPQGVQFAHFPDISTAGLQGMQQVRSMISQFSDTATDIAPQLSGKVRNATQVNAVQSTVSANLKNMIRADEHDVLQPLCTMTHMLLRQFQKQEYQISVQGPEKGQWITKSINPDVLHRDCQFVWRGSSIEEKSNIRSQQLMNGFNLALQVAGLMPEAINLPKLYKVVMEEAFNLKDLQVFPEDEKKFTIDPKTENMALDSGQDVKVNLGDVSMIHDPIHLEGFNKAMEEGDQEKAMRYAKHIESHKQMEQAKQTLQAQQAKLSAIQMAMGQEEGGGSEGGGGSGSEGNPLQQSNPSSEGDLMKGMRGSAYQRKGVRE